MLENACAKKQQFDPLRSQRRNFRKLIGRNGCAEQRHMSSVIVAARRHHRNRAAVIDAVRVCVDALVQLRGSAQRERPEKCHGDKCRDKCAPARCWRRERAHCAAIFRPVCILGKRFLQEILAAQAY